MIVVTITPDNPTIIGRAVMKRQLERMSLGQDGTRPADIACLVVKRYDYADVRHCGSGRAVAVEAKNLEHVTYAMQQHLLLPNHGPSWIAAEKAL